MFFVESNVWRNQKLLLFFKQQWWRWETGQRWLCWFGVSKQQKYGPFLGGAQWGIYCRSYSPSKKNKTNFFIFHQRSNFVCFVYLLSLSISLSLLHLLTHSLSLSLVMLSLIVSLFLPICINFPIFFLVWLLAFLISKNVINQLNPSTLHLNEFSSLSTQPLNFLSQFPHHNSQCVTITIWLKSILNALPLLSL